MRERARDKGRLEDILEYSENVTRFINGHTFESFVADRPTYYSVMKNVEIVGEAAYMLSKSFKKTYPATPWKVVQGMRHVLVHDYATIDDKELYNTAVNGIPELREQIVKYLAETDWESWESAPDDIEDSLDEEMMKLACRMKSDGLTFELITKYTGLTKETIEKL